MLNILNLENKINGLEPINREELFKLVSSWGRFDSFFTIDDIEIYKCEPNECYNLSNLDVSQITDLSYIFRESLYNGDLSKWNVSSCKNMEKMFSFSLFNNNSLNSWNCSNVVNMETMFYRSKFNGDISNWNVSNVLYMTLMFAWSNFDGDISKWNFNKDIYCYSIFLDNQNFINKYNYCKSLPYDTKYFLEWFEDNKNKIASLSITKEELLDIDAYLSNFNEKELKNGN